MAQLRVNPTRMEMKRLQTRYQTARKGHKLLKDKRDELMRQFLDVVREDRELRVKVENSLASYYESFGIASAVTGPQILETALICPKKEGELAVEYQNLMSVTVPKLHLRLLTDGGRDSYNYGMAFTSGELDASLAALGEIMEDMIRMAELEKRAQLLAEEIERTRRRVNALEHILMPQYLDAIKTIKMKLDENERGNITRLMKVKDMMIRAQLQGKREEEDTEADSPQT